MIDYLPSYEKKSGYFNELMTVGEKQVTNLSETIEDMNKQLLIDTATWALNIYEEELGIPTDVSKTYEERRSVIKSRIRGTGKVDAALIKLSADAYTNGDVEVSFNGKVVIKMTSYYGVPSNFDDLKEIMRDIIPAHLCIEYEYRYLLNKDIVNDNTTVGEFNELPLTYFAPIQVP